MKKEIRIIGFDDSHFDKFKGGKVLVVGTIFRGGLWMDGVVSTYAKVDGNNATKKLIELVNKTKHRPQLQYIMLDGIAVGGFNIIDIEKLNEKTGLPVMVIMRDYPDFEGIKKALKKIKKEGKFKLIEKAGHVHKIGKIYVQLKGLELDEARDVLRISCTRSLIPEPLRIAHLIASGVVTGESRGKA